MILQPFVENAIQHGMKEKTNGLITIGAVENDLGLLIWVEDNGPGISTQSNSSHISRGSSITNERIKLINKTSKEEITLKTISLKTPKSGTRIELRIRYSL